MRILIVGGDGKIGSQLVKIYKDSLISVLQTTRHIEKVNERNIFLDLSHDTLSWPLPYPKIDIVFFCASITSIDYCEKEPIISNRVNVENTLKLLNKFSDSGAFVVYISSNAVFNGDKPFSEYNETPDPKTEYGAQKAIVESELLKMNHGAGVAIVRFGKVITPNMPLISNWISKLKNEESITAFFDMFMAPISIDFAVNLLTIIAQKKMSGIVQGSAYRDISYVEAANYIAKKIGVSTNLVQQLSYKSAGISYSPKNTTLNSSRLKELNITTPSPLEAFDHFF